jgi:hypothetical protein
MDTVDFIKLPETWTKKFVSQIISPDFSFAVLAPPWGGWGVNQAESDGPSSLYRLAPPWGEWGVNQAESDEPCSLHKLAPPWGGWGVKIITVSTSNFRHSNLFQPWN